MPRLIEHARLHFHINSSFKYNVNLARFNSSNMMLMDLIRALPQHFHPMFYVLRSQQITSRLCHSISVAQSLDAYRDGQELVSDAKHPQTKPLRNNLEQKELRLNYVWAPANSPQFQSAGATLPAAGYAGVEPHGYATAVSQMK